MSKKHSESLEVRHIARRKKGFEKMGVKVGDIIDEVNRKPVDTLVQINRSLRSRNKVELKIVRDGESIKLDSPK